MNIRWDITVLAFLPWLIVSPVFGYDLSAIVESMGSKHECEYSPGEIHWISEKTSALVSGKKSEDLVRVCQLKFGLATTKYGARLRLSFDFMYNHACGVYLQINESTTSDFNISTSNREMLLSGCYTRDPGPLFAQPKNFILVTLVKENERLEAYNFRLNISMAEHLPTVGPDLHVVIIVGFVLTVVVILAAILLCKYITRLSYRWHEQENGDARIRELNIYNSHERLQEPDLPYLPGSQQPARSQAMGSEVYVHSNVHFKRKQPAQTLQARHNSNESRNHVIGHEEPPTSFHPGNIDTDSATSPCLGTDAGDTVSLGGCDIPPTYEEALGMPLATGTEKDVLAYL